MVGCQQDEMTSSMKKGSYSLVASIENNDSTSRTAVDENGGVTWVETDAIGVFGTKTKNAKFESTGAGANVTFVGELESSNEELTLAYYPYDENASLDGNSLSFTLPSEYTYTGESNAPMLGTKQTDGTFSFKHLCGLLKVTVKNMPENAKRLFVLSEETDEKEAPFITGDVTVNDVTADGATLSITKNGGREVSIDLKNVSAQETYTFFIPVPVGEYPKLSVKLEIDNGGVGFEKSVSNVTMKRALMMDMALIDIMDETINAKEVVISVDMDNTNGLYVSSFIDEVSLEDNNCSVDVITNGLPQFIFVSENDNILMFSRGYFEDDNNVINAESTALALVTMQPAFVLGEKEHYDMLKSKVMQSSNFPLLKSEVEKEIKARKDIFLTENANIPILINKIIEDVYGASSMSRSLLGTIISCLNNDPEPEPLTVRVDQFSNKVNIYNKNMNPAYECQVYRGGSQVIPSKVIAPTSNYFGIWDMLDGKNIHWGEPQEFSLSERGEYLFFLDMTTEKAMRETSKCIILDIVSLVSLGDSWDRVGTLKDFCGKIFSDLCVSIELAMLDATSVEEMTRNIFKIVGKYVVQQLPIFLSKMSYTRIETEMIGDVKIREIIEVKNFNLRNKLSNLFNLYNASVSYVNCIRRIKYYWEYSYNMPSVEFKLCKYDEITCCTRFILDKKESSENQVGRPNEKLIKPLTVGVKTEDGCDVKLDSYQKIKFEVISGDGILENQENEKKDAFVISSIDWRLGYSGEQKVKVVVYDEKLNMELSEPVYFTATFEPEEERKITTTEATNITQTTATLSGNIQGYETDDFGHRYGIIYSTDTTPTASNGTIVYSNNIQEDGNYSVDVTSLTENTTYYYRAFVINGGNYVYGDVMSFTTQKENMSERDILIAFYNATDGDNWKNNENWCSEKPLNEWYGIETNDEGFVTRITIRNNNVMGDVDFKGLNYLQDLDLNSNNITSLNVEDCKGIEELNCNFNSALATLNILGCNSLKGIQVKNCNLSSLDLSSCQNLTNLACQNNKLTSLEQLSSLTTLTGLSCSYNQLTELNISGNRNLQTLSVESNQLTELDVANFTELVFLYCENNQLKRLDVSNLSNLLTLDCDKNNLEELVLPKNASLQRLYCSWNQLKYLDLSGCTILERIGCLDNKLSSLNVSNSPLLVELNCSDNVISDLNTTNCTKIQILSIAVNQIEYLDVSYMSELERLYTQGNYIKQIYLPEGFTITPEDYDRYYTFWEEDGYQYPEFNWK